ncbi:MULTISPECIES: hypothetical protein [Corynebacterium]|uniref:hypothetical protein n=1 Tax=Corynebacterium TaxID=1716 RepID=UPI000668418A|nr:MULTISPECIES: hypothetical protein [Corynebacterium]KAA9220630.1 hypothetical protein F6I44_09540 [Corynebacterium amycolatum]KAA9223458.1 hypothetical protein F6I42_10265 [Corynebacterium amycolatum]KAA9267533.1 hypothetical protein F6I18_10235 [Corynebacterium amycolatum]MBC6767924.1 hypothetical protein [Corynebacterium sp. LK15]MBC6793076.1 hypothetical protein [Corynebacterium sp. LK26]
MTPTETASAAMVSDESVETRQGRDPRQSPKVRGLGVFAGLLIIAVAVVAGREAIISANGSGGTSWLQPVFDWFSNPLDSAASWVLLLVGILAAIYGLGQLIAVFLPAPRRYVRVDDDGNLPVWMHKSDYQELHNGTALASGVRGEYEGDDK